MEQDAFEDVDDHLSEAGSELEDGMESDLEEDDPGEATRAGGLLVGSGATDIGV